MSASSLSTSEAATGPVWDLIYSAAKSYSKDEAVEIANAAVAALAAAGLEVVPARRDMAEPATSRDVKDRCD